MNDSKEDMEKSADQQADMKDEELPIAPDPNMKFWKDTAKGLLGESIKSIEEAAKQIIGVASILEGLYFHAITYSNIRSSLDTPLLLLYISPLVCWLVSLCFAVLVFFPRTYAGNISSWRDSKAAFEQIVKYKHNMLKAAGIFLALGALFLLMAMWAYLAGSAGKGLLIRAGGWLN